MKNQNITNYCSLDEVKELQEEINRVLDEFHNGLTDLTSNVDRIASQAGVETSKKQVNQKFDEFMKNKVSEECQTVAPTLKEIAKPVVDYIRRNYHPHVTIIIDSVHAEVLEGVEVASYYENAVKMKQPNGGTS